MRNLLRLIVVKTRVMALPILFLLTSLQTFAQKQISGTVRENNTPVIGATVEVKGTNVATITNSSGGFSILVPEGRTQLVISFVGLETQTINLGDKTVIEVTMIPLNTTLNEVVVTGYTAQAKKDVTGSVAVVKVGDLKSTPAPNAESQLQGRASGVTVITDNRPGQGATVRIRGFQSFRDNRPLYVIDGVQTNSIVGLNPNDIESMQVLKDASALAIYGAKGAAGVIIITTKKGRQGAAKVSYNMYYGRQSPGKGFDLLNSQGMADLTWLAYLNAGQTPPSTQYGSGVKPVLPDYILPAGKFEGDPSVNPNLYNLNLDNINGSYLIMRANKQGTDWYDVITENAPIMNHNISLSGGADRSRYLFSFDYFDQKSYMIFSFFKRYSARVNTEFNIKKNIRIGQNLQVMSSTDNITGNNDEGTELAMAYRNQPIIPVFDIMGNFGGSRAPNLGNASNPYATRFRSKDNRGQNLDILGNMYAEVDFLRHFTARTSIGGNFNYSNYYFFTFKTYENSENNTGNSYTEGFQRYRNWIWTNQLTYRNEFGGKHDVLAVAGVESQEEWGRNIEGRRVNYFIEDLIFRSLNSGGAAGQVATGQPYTAVALYSLYSNLNYSYDDRFLATFNIRRDASSRFGPNNAYGIFPGGSIGWRISREKFMQNVNWITDLKIRGGYGEIGNQAGVDAANSIDQFRSGPGSSYYDINGTSNSTYLGFQLSFLGNPDGKWETKISRNIGFDATLFGGKTEIIFDYYNDDVEGLLFAARALAAAGAGPSTNPANVNIGEMRNQGVDVLITQRGMIGGRSGVKFDATLTFTTYKNKISALAPGVDFFTSGGSRIGDFARNEIGHPISSYYGYKVIGLFRDAADVNSSPVQDGAGPGRFKYADLDGDGTITPLDRTHMGNPHPAFTYGFNFNGEYRNFDFTFFFYGSQGKEAINYVKWWTDFFPSFQGAKSNDLLYNSWSPSNTGATTPIAENVSNFSNNTVPNSYYVENASYLRLKNLSIGYSLPTSVLNRFKIDRLRIYVQATNLFTATNYTGLDPEVGGGDSAFGIDSGSFPTVRQFLVGVNLGF